MKKPNIKKRIFNFSTFITSIVTIPLLLFVTFELLVTKDKLTELENYHGKNAQVLEKEVKFKSHLLNSIFEDDIKEENYSSISVDVSAYSASIDECDSSPHITANGTLSTVGRVAVSRDLLKKGITHGSRIYIPNQGVFIVADSMNARFTKRIDLLLANKKAAKLFGVKENVKIYFFRS
jgi:3D (Asp-Asp-Asp) domain-containing protein